jgi:hypothetical protein
MINKNELVKFYLERKLSVPQISRLIGKSEGEINYWIRKYSIKKRTISDAIYIKCNPNGDPFKVSSFLKDRRIFLDKKFIYGLGVGLYWGEGNKKSKNSVRLGNSDPKLILKFIDFLDKIFCIDKKKLRFGLQIFTDMSVKETLNFWRKLLKVNSKQFYKPIITRSESTGTYRQKSKYGVLTVNFCNTKLQKIIVEEIAKL